MSLEDFFDRLEPVMRRRSIIVALYPNKRIQQNELGKITGISSGNLSNYISELEAVEIINVDSDLNDIGQPVKMISLKPSTFELIESSRKILSQTKPVLSDFTQLEFFINNLMDPQIQGMAKDAIQLLSQKYTVPVDSIYYSFLNENLMKDELENARIVLIKSTKNMVSELNIEDKQNVLDTISNSLYLLLESNPTQGLEQETLQLLAELGVYALPFEDLLAKYLEQLSDNRDTGIVRELMLREHSDRLPEVWASLMKLYKEADPETKAKIEEEFPQLR